MNVQNGCCFPFTHLSDHRAGELPICLARIPGMCQLRPAVLVQVRRHPQDMLLKAVPWVYRSLKL